MGAAVEARLRAAGCLIVADEVQYGLGRSGSHFWGFERRGFNPDIVTMGKPVANGYPMGVVVANRALIEAFQTKFGFFSTFGGNAVAASAASRCSRSSSGKQLMANARGHRPLSARSAQRGRGRHECLGAVRGTGLLLGLEVKESGRAARRAKRIINRLAAESRVLIGYEGPDAEHAQAASAHAFPPRACGPSGRGHRSRRRRPPLDCGARLR